MVNRTHETLGSALHEIRLVVLMPVADEVDGIYCILKKVSLDEKPAYQALSYGGDANERP